MTKWPIGKILQKIGHLIYLFSSYLRFSSFILYRIFALLAAIITECVIRYDDDVPAKVCRYLNKCGSLCGACLTAIIWLMMPIKLNLLYN